LRSAPSGVCRPAPSPRIVTIGKPSRSTTATETLKPMLSHCASAALAMVCAIASGMFFCVTSPCAATGDDSAAIAAKLAKAFDIGDMNNYPWHFGDEAAPVGAYPFQAGLVPRHKNLRQKLFLELV